MALREANSALHWAATRPEDNTSAPAAVAVGHFVQVGLCPPTTPVKLPQNAQPVDPQPRASQTPTPLGPQTGPAAAQTSPPMPLPHRYRRPRLAGVAIHRDDHRHAIP